MKKICNILIGCACEKYWMLNSKAFICNLFREVYIIEKIDTVSKISGWYFYDEADIFARWCNWLGNFAAGSSFAVERYGYCIAEYGGKGSCQ